MNPLLEMVIRAARGIELAALADEHQHAAEEGHGTPEAAASAHREAELLCRSVAERFSALASGHEFMARRMEDEHAKERRSGIEYRGGSAA